MHSMKYRKNSVLTIVRWQFSTLRLHKKKKAKRLNTYIKKRKKKAEYIENPDLLPKYKQSIS